MAKLMRVPHIGLSFVIVGALVIAGALAAAPAHVPAQTPAPAGPQEAGVVESQQWCERINRGDCQLCCPATSSPQYYTVRG